MAELLLANVRLLGRSGACAILVREGRIASAAPEAELLAARRTETRVVDGQGHLAIPAFHDAHMHLLAWARRPSKFDCRGLVTRAALSSALRSAAHELPSQRWLLAAGYDERAIPGLDRLALDLAAPGRPVRVQSQALHLDVLNTAALRALELWDHQGPELERDALGQPTGRLYNAAALLRARQPPPSAADLRRDLRAACDRLLSWGVTSVQDATPSNGAAQWAHLHDLEKDSTLGVRLFMMWGLDHAAERITALCASRLVRHGPTKVMLDERASKLPCLAAVSGPVAFHAVSEAEVVLALAAIAGLPPALHRIEHGEAIPGALLPDLQRLGATVAGQPGLLHDRGDHYLRDYPDESRGWLYRAASLLARGIPYAISSDAPATEPSPWLALRAAQQRLTSSGAALNPCERLTFEQAVHAMTAAPAEAVGLGGELGCIQTGAIADIAIIEPDRERACITIMDGDVVFQR